MAHDFKVYAKDIDETHFEIMLTYSLMRSGQQEVKMGIMERKTPKRQVGGSNPLGDGF